MSDRRMLMSRWNPRSEWYTPRWLFAELDREFHFTLDPCAIPESALCARFYTPDDDGLIQPWAPGVCFVNPPWTHAAKWVAKAADEARLGATVVLLVPSRTETDWWHDLVWGKAEVRWIRGKLSFKDGYASLRAGRPRGDSPWPCCLVIFRPKAMSQ